MALPLAALIGTTGLVCLLISAASGPETHETKQAIVVARRVPQEVAQTTSAAEASRSGLPNVRPGDTMTRELIAEAYGRSGTFRTIIDAVEESSVVVFVRTGECEGQVRACLHFLAAEDDRRTLRISIVPSKRNGPVSVVALLAHELQHALEIIGEPSIRDVTSFAAFYAAHGHRARAGFETDQARVLARRVEQEFVKP